MSAINNVPVQVAGTPTNPVTVTNTGGTNIYVDADANVALNKHIGFLRPGDSHTFTDTAWLATDGTAGTYTTTAANSNIELAYSEYKAGNVAITAAATDIPNLNNLQVMVGARPIKLILDGQGIQISAAGNLPVINILEGATVLAAFEAGIGAVNGVYPLHREFRPNPQPAPGLHTYKCQVALAAGVAGANDRILAGAGSPLFFQAVTL